MKKLSILLVVLIIFGVTGSAQAGWFDALIEGATGKKPVREQKVRPSMTPKTNTGRGAGMVSKEVDPVCVKSAVEKRDLAVIASVDAYHLAISSALKARMDAVKTAWDNNVVSERRTAIKKAEMAYRKLIKESRDLMKSAQRLAWKQYKLDAKQCRAVGADDASTEILDSSI